MIVYNIVSGKITCYEALNLTLQGKIAEDEGEKYGEVYRKSYIICNEILGYEEKFCFSLMPYVEFYIILPEKVDIEKYLEKDTFSNLALLKSLGLLHLNLDQNVDLVKVISIPTKDLVIYKVEFDRLKHRLDHAKDRKYKVKDRTKLRQIFERIGKDPKLMAKILEFLEKNYEKYPLQADIKIDEIIIEHDKIFLYLEFIIYDLFDINNPYVIKREKPVLSYPRRTVSQNILDKIKIALNEASKSDQIGVFHIKIPIELIELSKKDDKVEIKINGFHNIKIADKLWEEIVKDLENQFNIQYDSFSLVIKRASFKCNEDSENGGGVVRPILVVRDNEGEPIILCVPVERELVDRVKAKFSKGKGIDWNEKNLRFIGYSNKYNFVCSSVLNGEAYSLLSRYRRLGRGLEKMIRDNKARLYREDKIRLCEISDKDLWEKFSIIVVKQSLDDRENPRKISTAYIPIRSIESGK